MLLRNSKVQYRFEQFNNFYKIRSTYLLSAIRGFEPSSSGMPIWPTWNCVPGPHTSLCIVFLGRSGLILSQELMLGGGTLCLLIFVHFAAFFFPDAYLPSMRRRLNPVFIYSSHETEGWKRHSRIAFMTVPPTPGHTTPRETSTSQLGFSSTSAS